MRIALLTPDFPAEGHQRYVFVQQLVFALVDMGINITVIAPQSLTHAVVRKEKVFPRHTVEKTENGNIFQLYRPYDLSFGNKLRMLTTFTKGFLNHQLSHIINRVKPDVLYGHFWSSAMKMKDYALKHNLPLFVACGEGDNALEDLDKSLSKKQRQELHSLIKGVISVSSENKRKCIKYGFAREQDIVVLPNAVDGTLFHPINGTRLRKDLKVANDDFLILFVGGFIHRKGTKNLSEAIQKLNDKHIKSIFIGAPLGGDSEIPECYGIVYKGPMDHSKLPEFFNAADVFVLPTLNEGCSNAIVEALACGTPVISSDRPFNYDILNENNSILVNPESVDQVVDAIIQMKDDKNLYCKKKKYVLEHTQDHSITIRAQKIYDFICERTKVTK